MNKNSDLFFTKREIQKIRREYPTPFIYFHEGMVRERARLLNDAFSWAPSFKNFFAVKAEPNPTVVDILRQEKMGADCSSGPELVLSYRAGIRGENIMFTSNNTPDDEFRLASSMGVIINLDDITHIRSLQKNGGIPEVICFRYNPGPLRKTAEGNVIGKPEDAKYGLTRDQLFEAYKIMKNKGVKRFGLHQMIASNDRRAASFIETANMLFDLVGELSKTLGIKFEFVNLGGGMGIPYRPWEGELELKEASEGIKKAYEEKIVKNGLGPLNIYMENGRFITGPTAYLVTTAIHEKHTYKEYIGVDACMANLMRPGMYGAYHHITVLGKEYDINDHKYDIVGGLCENNDKFAIDRMVPKIDIGDLLAIHNAGAHAQAMCFNYNGKLRGAQLLRRLDSSVEVIRRAETIDDHFATLTYPGSKFAIKKLSNPRRSFPVVKI